MKRVALMSATVVFFAALAVSLAGAQNAPLGDYARQVRKQKAAPAHKTFDNDNLPQDDKVSVVGQATDQTADRTHADTNSAPQTTDANNPSGDTANPSSGDEKSSAEQEQAKKEALYKEWQSKIHHQREQIDLANRELDIANREYRLRAAAFYADAGNRLRNAGAWDKEDGQYKDQIAAKQKALDDAKQVLDDMQEQARKAGVPSSMRD
jgi:hypothetical protein